MLVTDRFSEIHFCFRQCTSKKIYIIGSNHSVHYCSEKCARETFCGDVTVPKDHLQQCHVCTKHDSCETIGEEGPGVDADFVLYISAKDTHRCRPSDTLATASFCQLESEHDRFANENKSLSNLS